MNESTERHIQFRLFWDNASGSELQMPNFTPYRWWECDLFRVTKAGYFYEYEIKLSISDFRRDKEKKDYDYITKVYRSKHDRLAEKDERGPSRFYYVVPEEISEKVLLELPEWAGLIESRKSLRTIKQAPNLHRKKISRAVIRQVKTSALARYWDLFLRFPQSQKIQTLEYKIEDAKKVAA